MEEIKQDGLFITPQEDLTESVYNNLLVKPKHKEIKKEINKFIEGLK
jgi:hypothetical protein